MRRFGGGSGLGRRGLGSRRGWWRGEGGLSEAVLRELWR